jgi:hypothetical protein
MFGEARVNTRQCTQLKTGRAASFGKARTKRKTGAEPLVNGIRSRRLRNLGITISDL